MDHTRFERTVAVYRSDFYGLALKILGDPDDAEDVAQEALLRLWDIRDRLDQYASVRSLGMIIVRHKCIDLRRQTVTTTPLDEAASLDSGLASAEQEQIGKDMARQASQFIETLPAGQREVFRMRHLDDMEISEIASATGSTDTAVRVALCRARAKLKQMFFKQDIKE